MCSLSRTRLGLSFLLSFGLGCGGGTDPAPTLPGPHIPVPPAEATDVLGSRDLRMPGPIQMVSFREGRLVAVSEDGAVRAFDPQSGEMLRELDAGATVWDAVARRDDLLLRTTEALLSVDLETDHVTVLGPPPGSLLGARPDGTTYFADDRALIEAPPAGQPLRRIPVPMRPEHVSTALGGAWAGFGGEGRVVLIPGTADRPTDGLAAGSTGALALDPRGRWVVVQDPRSVGELDVWSLRSGDRVATLEAGTGTVGLIQFSPDGAHLAAVGGRRLQLWRTEGWTRAVDVDGVAYTRTLDFSPEGALLAIGGNDNTVRVFDVSRGRELHVTAGHRGNVEALAWHRGTLFSGGRFDGRVIRWDGTEGETIVDLGVGSLVESVVPTGEGTWVVTPYGVRRVGDDTTLELRGIGRAGAACGSALCVATSEALLRIRDGQVTKLADIRDAMEPRFSAAGDRVALGYDDGLVVRRTDDGSQVARLHGDNACLLADGAAFGPAGAMLVFEELDALEDPDGAGRAALWRSGADDGPRHVLPMPAAPSDGLFLTADEVVLVSPEGVHLWQPARGTVRTVPVGGAYRLAWRGEGRLAVGTTEGTVVLLPLHALRNAQVAAGEPPHLPDDCQPEEGRALVGRGAGGLGLLGTGGAARRDDRYFGMFSDPAGPSEDPAGPSEDPAGPSEDPAGPSELGPGQATPDVSAPLGALKGPGHA